MFETDVNKRRTGYPYPIFGQLVTLVGASFGHLSFVLAFLVITHMSEGVICNVENAVFLVDIYQ